MVEPHPRRCVCGADAAAVREAPSRRTHHPPLQRSRHTHVAHRPTHTHASKGFPPWKGKTHASMLPACHSQPPSPPTHPSHCHPPHPLSFHRCHPSRPCRPDNPLTARAEWGCAALHPPCPRRHTPPAGCAPQRGRRLPPYSTVCGSIPRRHGPRVGPPGAPPQRATARGGNRLFPAAQPLPFFRLPRRHTARCTRAACPRDARSPPPPPRAGSPRMECGSGAEGGGAGCPPVGLKRGSTGRLCCKGLWKGTGHKRTFRGEYSRRGCWERGAGGMRRPPGQRTKRTALPPPPPPFPAFSAVKWPTGCGCTGA